MKKMIIFAVVAFLMVSTCAAQTSPVFNYTSPSKNEMKVFALASTKKSSEYRKLLVSAVQRHVPFTVTEANISWIFDQLTSEEISLGEETYQNSGWNASTQKMETSTGHAYHGFVWVFRYNGISFPLIKGNCGNILLCSSFEAVAQTAPKQPVIDTVYIKKVVVVEQEVITQPSNPNERIVTAGKTVTVGYGATNYPDNQYYSGYGQPCCGGMFFSVGYNYGSRPRPYGGYVNNHYNVDYGAQNYPAPQGGNNGSVGTPRPSNVTVGFGGGGNGTNTGGNTGGGNTGGNGNGSGGRP